MKIGDVNFHNFKCRDFGDLILTLAFLALEPRSFSFEFSVEKLRECLPSDILENATKLQNCSGQCLTKCLSECDRMEYEMSTTSSTINLDSIDRFINAIQIPYKSR